MIPVANEFTTAIKRGYSLEGAPLIIAEWNYNNLFDTTVTSDSTADNWVMSKDYFPVESVVTGIRPTKSGMFYALTNESYSSSGSEITNDRFYVANDTSKYKYWICPNPSASTETEATITSGSYTAPTSTTIGPFDIDRANITVDYGQYLNMNKLSVTFNLGPIPQDWSYYIWEETAGTWVEITNPTIDPITGKCELWWNGTAWIQTQQLDENLFQRISKVKIEVRSVDLPNRRLQVVELAGKREINITARVEGYSINSSLDEQDYVSPIGRMSSNDGKISLNNNDLKMDPNDPTSDFFGLLDGWCQYRTYVQYDLSPWGGSNSYLMRTGTMFSNGHQQVNEYQYEVDLFDIFKICQSVDCPSNLFENVSIAKVFSILLDLAGIDTYQFEFDDYDSTHIVKYFWTDGTTKLFDVLDDLCKSYQAASFVDEFGMIRLLTRTDIIPTNGEPFDWTFLGEKEGLDIPDIINLQKKYELQANQVNIKYTKRQAKVDDTDITEQPLTSSIWEASDTVVLRAAPLVRTMVEDDLNGLPQRSFDDGISSWTAHNATVTQSAERYYVGGFSARIVPNGTSANGNIESAKVSVPVERTVQANAQVWFTNSVSSNFSLSINWYDSAGSFISTSSNYISVGATTWTKVAVTFTAPTNAVTMTLVPTLRGTPASSQVWFVDDTILYPVGMPDNWDIWIDGTKAETWPFVGTVNIEGEVIKYDGKGYAWWDYSTGVPIYHEGIVHDNDERKALDRQSYQSWQVVEAGIIGGVSSDPTQQNKYTGRLRATTRDSDQTGQRSEHTTGQSYGWYIMDFWTNNSQSLTHPGHYFSPGIPGYNILNLKDWVNKPGWGGPQRCVSVANSIVTIDNHLNTAPAQPNHATIVTRDLGGTEFRELGTRMRISSNGVGRAVIAFYMTNTTGYDTTSSPLEEPYYANRCYVVGLQTTTYCDSVDRASNEVSVHVKNFDTFTKLETLPHMKLDEDTDVGDGKIKIDADKWYDVDLVFRDGVGESDAGTAGRSTIEVYIDGAYVDTWTTTDNIRPTGIVALGARDLSKVDFEYFYSTTTTNRGRDLYLNEDNFNSFHVNLPAGTNVKKRIAFPFDGVRDRDFGARGVMSLSTWGVNASIAAMEFSSPYRTYVTNTVGQTPLVLKKDQRLTLEISDYNYETGYVTITYSATNDISVCFEYTTYRSYPYGIDNEALPAIQDYYDFLKGGYYSSKKDEFFYAPQRYTNTQYVPNGTTPTFLSHFFDDFGAIAHEVRDFTVDYETSPAKGVGVYCSNEKAKVIGHKYSPIKGKFTLVNISHKDEIINGTEQLDESNSIDYSLMMYGYILEEQGDQTETVKNELSIIRHGIISQDLDASWIFNKDEAISLGEWITSNWGYPMDALQLGVFVDTHIQIGDKASIHYSNASIDPASYYLVTGKDVTFDGDALAVVVTVRRVK